MKPVRTAARAMLSAVFISGGWNQLRQLDWHTEVAKPVTDRIGPRLGAIHPKLPTDTTTLVLIDGIAKLGGGLMLATGRGSRPAALVLASSLVPTTLAAHQYWQIEDPQERMQQRVHFYKNLGLFGGLLLAAVDTEGRPGLGWRARYATRRANRAARRVGRTATLARMAAEHTAKQTGKAAGRTARGARRTLEATAAGVGLGRWTS